MRFFRQRFTWYRARLAAMSSAEVAYRLREAARKQGARKYNVGWNAVKPQGNLASLAGVAERICMTPPELATLIRQEAAHVRAGSFHLLGANWPRPIVMPPPPTFWHLDPDTGAPFLDRHAYCFDLSWRHGINTQEIKRIWELNRLQFMPSLAADAVINGEHESADLLWGLLRSWMDANAPYRGLSWNSGIELALRATSIALSLSILGFEHLDAEKRITALKFFFAHIDWIKRFPSLHSSSNNHRIAELTGLVVGTTVVPDFPGATNIREASWRNLLVEINRQIHPDGVGAEQSVGYTALSVELFLLAAIAYECPVPKITQERLSAWAEHSLWLMDANGKVAAIGDFDDCRAIATTQSYEPRYVASIVAAVAGYLSRPDLAPPGKDPSLRDLLFKSTENSALPREGLRCFPTGGYTVIRAPVRKPALLIFDHGPVGYLTIAAHGHADSLSVWLSLGAQPVLVDAGTYLYFSNRELRDQFRGTAAHNTLTLHGEPSSRASGPFNWATKANATLIALEQNGSRARMVAEHDGYLSRFHARHRRMIEFDGTSRFMIADELIGPATQRDVCLSFLVDPSCHATLDSDGNIVVINDKGAIVRFVNGGPLGARIVRGNEFGWMSPSFGVRLPADQILFEGTLQGSSTITLELL